MLDYQALGPAEEKSLWLKHYGPYEAEPPLRGDRQVDVAIIGGGFTGLSSAWHVKQHSPGASVALLEGSVVGYGASGRNGGFSMTLFGLNIEVTLLLYGKERTREAQLYMEQAVDYVQELSARHQFESDYRHPGFLRVAFTDTHEKRLRGEYEAYTEKLGLGNSFQWWDRDTIRDKFDSPIMTSGFYEPRCGLLNPAKHVREWKRLALDAGVEIYENTPSQKISRLGQSGKVVVETAGGTVTAGKLVLATNAYSHLLDGAPKLKNKQTPVWTYQIATEPLSAAQWDAIGWAEGYGIESNRMLIHYFRPTADGRITFGGADVANTFGRNMAHDASPETWATLERHLFTLFPQLKGIGIDFRWGGPVSVTLDMVPSLGFLGDERIIYSCGCLGHGVSLTQLNGKTIAHLLAGEKSSLTDAWFVNRKSLPYPPEPLKSLTVGSIASALRFDDWRTDRKIWQA